MAVGTHEELMQNCSAYQEIYYSQFPEGGFTCLKQTVNEDKIQKSKVQAESKPQSKDRKMSRGEILKVFGHLGKYRIFVVFLFCWQQSASPLRSTFETDRLCGR